MHCTVIHGRDLTAELSTQWSVLRAQNAALVSPYFCPGFTLAVAAVREDVRVAVLERDGAPWAFFPFQQRAFGRAVPVGGPLSDYQAVITAENDGWDARELVRSAGLSCWDFDHLLCVQSPFAAGVTNVAESPVMDLSDGYDAYVSARRTAGSKVFKKLGTLRRKLERDVGPLRFEAETRDGAVLDQLLAWKRDQCRRTGTVDIFEADWSTALVRRLLQTQEDGFAGVLSGLWVGDELIAAHFGMRSRKQWHYWFPTYNHDYSQFSPGLLLLDRIAQHAASVGVESVDLGKGAAPYKGRVRSRGVAIAEGAVRLPSLAETARSVLERTDAWVQSSSLAKPLRAPARALRRFAKRMRYR